MNQMDRMNRNTDCIETIGQLQLHHGKDSDRMYVLDYGTMTPVAVHECLQGMNEDHGYGKIIIKAKEAHKQGFMDCGYRQEAVIKGYDQGRDDCLYMVYYINKERKKKKEADKIKELLDQVTSEERGALQNENLEYSIRCLNPDDVEPMIDVFAQVFDTYPFPIYDPSYIRQTMNGHNIYYGVWDGKKLVAVSSAEINAAKKNVEMTDFAILPAYRGQKLSRHLLKAMEGDMKTRGFQTAFTIARSLSFPMNKTFYRLGYTYGGTLWNNTQIGGSIESMNVWYKPLIEG